MAPRSSRTYRLQLRPGFGFDDAAAVAGYLADLGVSHVYCSPFLQAAPGSTHGYDVVDHRRVNDELGGAEAARPHGRGRSRSTGWARCSTSSPTTWPSPAAHNRWWWDVLENGPVQPVRRRTSTSTGTRRSKPPQPRAAARPRRPLRPGARGGRAARSTATAARFVVRYHDHAVPGLAPLPRRPARPRPAARCGSDELASLAGGLRPPAAAPPPPTRAASSERHRDKEVLRAPAGPPARRGRRRWPRAVDAVVAATNADPDALDALLERQNYRLAFWRTAGQELDYRRFFDITTLVGLRIEDEQVFADTHALVLELVRRRPASTGLRDRPPRRPARPGGLPRAGCARRPGGAWVVVEKILEPGERLPRRVAGRRHHRLRLPQPASAGLFVDPAGEAPLTELYGGAHRRAAPTGTRPSREKKHLVLREVLAADVQPAGRACSSRCASATAATATTPAASCTRRCARCSPLPRLPHLRPCPSGRASPTTDVARGRARRSARRRRAPPRPRRRACSPSSRDLLLLRRRRATPRPSFALRFQQLTGPGHGQGRRGHRLLPLQPAGLASTRSAATRAASARRSTSSTPHSRAHGRATGRRRCWPRRPTTPSAARTCGPASALLSEIPGAVGRRRAPLVGARTRATARDGWPDRERRVPALPDARRRLPARRRPGRRLHGEGDPGGQGRTRRGSTPTPAYDEAVRRVRARPSSADAAFAADLEALRRPARRARPGRRRWPRPLLKLTAPGRARHLPGHRAVGPQPGRPRQPPPGRLRRRAAALLAELGRARRRTQVVGAARRGRARSCWLTHRALAAAAGAGPTLFGPAAAYEPLRGAGASGRPRRRPSCGAAGARSSCPGSCSAWRRRRWRRHHRRAAGGRVARRADRRRGASGGARRVSASCSAGFPVALLVRAVTRRSAVWAPDAPSGSSWSSTATPACRWRAGDGGWFDERRRRARHRLRLLARRRPAPARPPLAVAARRRARPVARRRPRRLRVDRRRLAAASTSPSAVVYELHVGTFTPEGTFDGAIARLDHLVDLGVDARRADAGGRVPGRPGLGLRRRRPLRPPPRLRRARRAQAAGRRLPRRAASP